MEDSYPNLVPSSTINRGQEGAIDLSISVSRSGLDGNAAGPDESSTRCRIAVVPSMLFAYASMRGNQNDGADSSTSRPIDPLHQTLFMHKDPCKNHAPILMTATGYGGTLEELAGNVELFWDPNQPNDRFPSNRTGSVANEYPARCYEDFKEHLLPNLAPNHPHGQDGGLEDAGYLKINGLWTDPESQLELHAAFTGGSVNRTLPLPTSNNVGPKIMECKEGEEFYKQYTAEVTDHCDLEGDPRLRRISPETFKAWACGAVMGDRYVTEQVPTQELWRDKQKIESSEKPKHPPGYGEYVFDIETGSVMSGWTSYSSLATPSFCYSARGVDPFMKPDTFDRMLPGVGQMLERAKYGGPEEVRRWLESTSTIDAEPINLQNMHMNFIETGGFLAGDDEFNELTEGVYDSRKEAEREEQEYARLAQDENSTDAESERIFKENFYLERYLARLPSDAELRRSRHLRILMEVKEAHNMAAARAKDMQRAAKELQETKERQLEEMRKYNEKLLKRLKVRGAEELPEGFRPTPELYGRWDF